MDGCPIPIGYALEDRKLVPDAQEAATVRLIFERYVELRSMAALVDDLHERGIGTKQRTYRDGRMVGGIPFTKGPLAQLLQNPIYIGKVRHRDQLHEGQHEAIIEANRQAHRTGARATSPNLLTSMLFDPDGQPMSPVHTAKAFKRYRYYETRTKVGGAPDQLWRLPAGEIDRLVVNTIADRLRSGSAHEDAHSAAHASSKLELLATSIWQIAFRLLRSQTNAGAYRIEASGRASGDCCCDRHRRKGRSDEYLCPI